MLNAAQMECPSPPINNRFLTDALALRARRSTSALPFSYPTESPTSSSTLIRSQLVARRKQLRSLSGSSNAGKAQPQIALRIGFIMDDVETAVDLNKHFQSLPSQLLYVEDPKFFQFPNDIKLYKGDTLVIEV